MAEQVYPLQDLNEPLLHLRSSKPGLKTHTVKFDNLLETGCSVWFFLLCFVMLILLVMGLAVHIDGNQQRETFNHAFCIPLALYQISLFMLCAYYCSAFKPSPYPYIWKLMKFNKFWFQSLFCSLFNFITFLLLTINLTIKLNDHEIDSSNKWFYANVAVYFCGIFSIPFPAICIKLHYAYKYDEFAARSRFNSTSQATPSRRQPAKHQSVSLQHGDNIRDNVQYASSDDAVKVWLRDKVKLPEYSDLFEHHNIDNMNKVRYLGGPELKEIGIDKVGDRMHMLQCIKELNPESSIVQSMPPRIPPSMSVAQPIFREAVIKGAIILCYAVTFLAYIGNPSLNNKSYLVMNDILYPGYNAVNKKWTSLILHDINQIFLRTFMGMSITSVFFMIVTELTDKKLATTKYRVLWDMYKEENNLWWMIVLILFVMMISLEVFELRHTIQTSMDIQHAPDLVDILVNGIWIFINLSAAGICIIFCVVFGGTYDRTKKAYATFSGLSSPTSPIRAFVLEAITLCGFYAVYVVFVFMYDINHWNDDSAKPWDNMRQSSILILTIFQFWSLIKVKQTQKFKGYWYVERFDKNKFRKNESRLRFKWILHGYYKLNCIVIMYNVVYIFMFKMQYFGAIFTSYISNDHQHIYANIGYAFSFSLSSSMLFVLSHFLASYEQWRNDRLEYSEGNRFNLEEAKMRQNAALNKHMKIEEANKPRTNTVDSAITQFN